MGLVYLPKVRIGLQNLVTTREKGTGLGLAIVAKIVEDHGGILKIQDVSEQQSGAVVTVTIPLVETENSK